MRLLVNEAILGSGSGTRSMLCQHNISTINIKSSQLSDLQTALGGFLEKMGFDPYFLNVFIDLYLLQSSSCFTGMSLNQVPLLLVILSIKKDFYEKGRWSS